MSEAKPYEIAKWDVWKAFEKVRANHGAAGIDGQSIEDFEQNVQDNLYKIWNRMSSGSYVPPPVRTVEIPKGNGKMRPLGIPTVGDRVAQQVAKQYLEPLVDPCFHADSYGYRPGKSALVAAWQGRVHQGGAMPSRVTTSHGPDIQPCRQPGNRVLDA
jgi:retron-type reverse transcriptase